MQTLSDIGSYASIAGLIISIFVLILTYRINRKIKLQVRVPGLVERLSSQASKLKTYGRKFEKSHDQIRVELSSLEANLVALKQNDKKAQGSVDRVLIAINSYRANPGDREAFLEIHSELIYLIGTAKNLHEDRIMER
jgi:hypothetical protein